MKIRKTVIQFTVLSDEEQSFSNWSRLGAIDEECNEEDGEASGSWHIVSEEILEGDAAEAACLELGTDPSFFSKD